MDLSIDIYRSTSEVWGDSSKGQNLKREMFRKPFGTVSVVSVDEIMWKPKSCARPNGESDI